MVITSAKKTFFAGGNLKSMMQATPDDAPRIFAEVEEVKAQLRRLETLGKPVVAAVNGSALGGGLEIALACHHRIAVDDPKTEIGLPEVTLGLLPGGGGVTRTVRMLGLSSALLDVLLQGPRMKPQQAKDKGLRRRARRPRGPAHRREGVDHREPRRRRGGDPAVGPPRLQDARRHPVQPQARRIPAGLPGQPAQAAQGRRLPGAEGDPGRRRRGRPGRPRHRDAHRVPLVRQPGHRSQRQEHDPGVLLRPPGDQRRSPAARRLREVHPHQGRGARRRDDGRRHRLLLRPRRPRGRAQGRQRRERRDAARPTPPGSSTRPWTAAG